MISFELHSDGTVHIRGALGEHYADSVANFELDMIEIALIDDLGELPEGATERIYVQNVRHAINGDDGTIAGGPVPWQFGDAAIAAVAALLVAQTARRAIPPTPPVVPDPGLIPPKLIAAALSISIANGDVASVDGAFNLVGAIYLGVGQYMLLFAVPPADTNYFIVMNDGGKLLTVSDKQTDYITIESRDVIGGPLTEASNIAIQVFKF